MNKTPIGPVVRTRMAPSPTGEYHVGHIATLLKNYAFAKKHHGSFILRIEDTDQERKVDGAVERIMGVIKSYGLSWDEGPDCGGPHGPYVQSERLAIYKQYVQQLLDEGKAYHCFCSKERLEAMREAQMNAKEQPRYDGHCRSLSAEQVNDLLSNGAEAVVRLKVPKAEVISFTDLIRGPIEIASDQVDDQVLLKSDGFPTYHLAVVVDDHLMEITHVLRGEEWISSTPKHILLYRSFGWQPPYYAHIPVFLNPDGKGKMSKRKGSVAAISFVEAGYLPEALLNFFMILGWTPHDQREILTLDEYIAEFDPSQISPKSVVFDLDKLKWINGQYIRALTMPVLIEKLKPFLPADFPHEKAADLIPLISERLVTLKDVEELTSFFYRPIQHDKALLLAKSTPGEVNNQLMQVHAVLSASEWTKEILERDIRKLQETQEWKKSQFFMLIRVAITGKSATPPLFDTLLQIGKTQCLERLNEARHLCIAT